MKKVEKDILVLCFSMAGISRSTTLVISYIMTVCEMSWCDSMNAVRAARKGANPNYGFQRQLQNFEFTTLKMVLALI
jgi:protein-tyrosine phosphatase